MAVLAVLLFHAGVPGLDGGYVGVDVFFVLSGFLITSLMLNERAETGRISLVAFYSRRIRRILPMSSIVAVLTLGASWLWLEPLRMKGLATDVLASAGFASNFVFAHRGADYLQSTLPPSPLQHFWSLAVEEQFYVVWPALTVIVCLGVVRERVAMLRLRVAILSSVVAVASFATCMSLMNENQVWAFYRPQARAFELAVGALLAAVPAVSGWKLRVAESLLAWCGLAGVIASVFVFDEMTRLSQDPSSAFAGWIDLSRPFGVTGHSFGAYTSVEVANQDPRVAASLPMALTGVIGPDYTAATMLLLATEDKTIGEDANQEIRDTYDVLPGPRFLGEFPDGGHYSFSFACYLGLGIGNRDGCGEGKRFADGSTFTFVESTLVWDVVDTYSIALFGRYLKGIREYDAVLATNVAPGIMDWQADLR